MFERIVTSDGSITYFNTEIGASYRSVHGAESESRQVFLQGTGLDERPSPWRVLELGFGTGLNFQVTHQAAKKAGIGLEYVSLEPSPLPEELWLVDEDWRDLDFDQPKKIGQIQLSIIKKRWQDFIAPTNYFHVFYHDPFGPGQAPECWTAECFRWSAAALTQDGVLATFGAASAPRQAMKDAGYAVGRLPGANGKREMTVASKSEAAIAKAKPWKRPASTF